MRSYCGKLLCAKGFRRLIIGGKRRDNKINKFVFIPWVNPSFTFDDWNLVNFASLNFNLHKNSISPTAWSLRDSTANILKPPCWARRCFPSLRSIRASFSDILNNFPPRTGATNFDQPDYTVEQQNNSNPAFLWNCEPSWINWSEINWECKAALHKTTFFYRFNVSCWYNSSNKSSQNLTNMTNRFY